MLHKLLRLEPQDSLMLRSHINLNVGIGDDEDE